MPILTIRVKPKIQPFRQLNFTKGQWSNHTKLVRSTKDDPRRKREVPYGSGTFVSHSSSFATCMNYRPMGPTTAGTPSNPELLTRYLMIRLSEKDEKLVLT
jgi:hypothetical protein